MMIGPCKHYECTNRNSFGYCRTTACINERHKNEWVESTSANSPDVVYIQQTNHKRLIAKSPKEFAEWLNSVESTARYYGPKGKDVWLKWLQQEVNNESN